MELSTYLKIYPCPEQPGMQLVYSTARSSSVLLPDELLAAARSGTLPDQEQETLTRLGILVPDRREEQQRMRRIFSGARQQDPPFNAVVVLNLDCNLACPYCYEGNFRHGQYMTDTTADQLTSIILADHFPPGGQVGLTFYGGEPLLSLDLIRRIAQPLHESARQREGRFSFSLVTNGTLLNAGVVEELLSFGLRGAKITLDGPAELHNLSRPFVSGQGSFESILRNVAAVCRLLPLQLGGNYTRDNYRSFPRLLDDLLAAGVTPDKVATVLFAPVIPKSGGTPVTDFNSGCACSYEPWLIEASLFLREETLKRGFSAPKPKLAACMVELENEVVVNYDGSLYKCPAFMSHPELSIGSLESGIADYRRSHNLELWHGEQCLACPYLPLCFGGCRQMTLLRTGRMEQLDCRREFYDASLEAIIRQDLLYQRGK